MTGKSQMKKSGNMIGLVIIGLYVLAGIALLIKSYKPKQKVDDSMLTENLKGAIKK